MGRALSLPISLFMSETKIEKKKKSKKVWSIIGYVACGLIFLFVAYELVIRFTNNELYLFGIRSDVVLTDSMSYKNEDPEIQEFLKGHDDQLQVGDLIYSVRITESTELNVYDKVMFIHPDTGKLTTHRIVRIFTRDGVTRYTIRADTANEASYDGAFTREMLKAKVVGQVPWVGRILQFLQSFWGTLLLVGVIIIILLYDFLSSSESSSKKKKQSEAIEAEASLSEPSIESATKEESKEERGTKNEDE